MTAASAPAPGMLSAAQAIRIGGLTCVVAATASFERVRGSLPSWTDLRFAKAHRLTDRLVEEDAPVVRGARREIDELLGPCGPDIRWAIAAAAAARVGRGSVEEVVLGLGLAAADLYVAGRTADHLAMILDLGAGHERASAIRGLFEQANKDLAVARSTVIAAVRVLRRMPRIRRYFPAEVERTARALSRLVSEPPPAFDDPPYEAAGRRSRPGQRWCERIKQAIWDLEAVLSLPPAPAWPPPPPSLAETSALAEILAHPDDTAARLRWAELAERRGELRAALVRAQVELRETVRRRPESERFESRRSRSLVEWHPEWAAPVRRLGAREVAFRRGFVEWVSIDARTFLRRAPEIFAVAPILYVKLTDAAPLLPDLLASNLLSRLLALDLSGQGLDDGHVEALTRASGLAGLRSLDLSANRIGAAGAALLHTATSLPSLVHCPLDGNPCGPMYELGYTHQEYPTEEWVATPLKVSLAADFGERPWTTPYRTPPDFDALTALIDPMTGRPPNPRG